MTASGRAIRAFLFISAFAVLAACQSAEERAEGHYQRALELQEAGDFDRARVEFLNVFQHNGHHRDARAGFAAMQRDRGELQESYSQYLRLVEQYPDHIPGRVALAEMALQFGNWEEARRHGDRAIEEIADDTDSRIVVIAAYLQYLDALEEEDVPARREAYDRAEALFVERPDDLLLRRLRIDHLLREGAFDEALVTVDDALTTEPLNRMLNDIRLSILADQGEAAALEAHLLTMLERFPQDEELPALLLRYYLAQGTPDQAIAFLRAQAAAAPDEATREDALVAMVQLQLQLEGPEAALAALDDILASEAGRSATFGALRAAIRFELGDAEAAIAELEEILQGELSVIEAGQVRVALARMLMGTGNSVGARAQIEQTLEADPGQADALTMLASMLIEEDEPDRAIGNLRSALETNPDNPTALTLMAQAHARNGDHVLAREFYALAVEASNSAPAETLRYARLLIEDGSLINAEEQLITALRLQPDNTEILSTLGQLYVQMEDWPRARQVEDTLRERGDEVSIRLAAGLQVSRLAAEGRTDDALVFLEDLAAEGGTSDVTAQIAVIRARLISGDGDGALSFAEQLVADAPDELAYQFALAATQSALGEFAAAEASFRALTEQLPQSQQAWIGLIRVINSQGRLDEALEILDAALASLPEALDLLWAQASFREQVGDYEGAIEIYERMYERAPNAQVVANNLASLLSTYREDEASLDRAWTVARRLRGIEVAPFQDTYGWLAYRRGDYDEALAHLEPAAEGLPTDPLVQYHLGMTYAALGRSEEAIVQLQQAVDLAGPEDARTQFETARSEIARLQAAVAEAAAAAE